MESTKEDGPRGRRNGHLPPQPHEASIQMRYGSGCRSNPGRTVGSGVSCLSCARMQRPPVDGGLDRGGEG